MSEAFPKAWEYLLSNRARLEQRKQYRSWYGYSAPRNLALHDKSDILIPLLADRGRCALIPGQQNEFCVMASAGFSLGLQTSTAECPHRLYILGLINSKLLFWNLRQISNRFRGGWVTCTKQYFGTLPIRQIDPANKDERTLHDHIVELVEEMLALQERLVPLRDVPTEEQAVLERRAALVDRDIDEAVYTLYGLTDREQHLVETK